MGLLIAVIGGTLVVAGRRDRVGPEIRLLGVASAAGLGAVDVLYVHRRRIARNHLLDALAEVGLLAAWALARRRRVRPPARSRGT